MDVRFTITVEGKPYPCLLTMGAMDDYKRETGRPLNLGEQLDASDILTLIWACAASEAERAGKALPWTRRQLAHLLTVDEGADAINAYSAALRATLPADEEEAKKGLRAPADTDELFGIGLGYLGLSLRDYRLLTPAQFGAVCHGRELAERNAWERARLQAFISLQPYLPKGHAATARTIIPLPWDTEAAASRPAAEHMTKEQRLRRVQELLDGKL